MTLPLLQITESYVNILLAISIIMIIGYMARALFNRTKIPEVLILMLIGIILVPIGHLLPDNYVIALRSIAQLFGALALIIIMYDGGRKMDLAGSLRSGDGVALGVLDVLIPTVAIAYLMNLLFGWPIVYGALLGAIFGSTSSAIIIPVLRRFKVPGNIYNALVMETAMNSVIAITVFTVLLATVTGQSFSPSGLVLYVADYISVAISIGIIAGFLWLLVLSKIKTANEYLAAISIAILLYGVVTLLDGAAIISVLIFAIMVGNYGSISRLIKLKINISNEAKHQEEVVGKSLEFLIRTFFFVFIGMIAVLSYQYVEYAILIVAALVITRYAEVKLVLRKSKPYQSLALSFLQRGTVVAVLATLLYSIGVGADYFNQIFYISFLLLIFTNIIGSLLLATTKIKISKDSATQ